jgi:hypothetical protein
MVFLLYKINSEINSEINNDNSIILTGVYENENDAIEVKNLYNDESFKIADLPFWKKESEKKPFIYTEEDNDINESDLEDYKDKPIVDNTYMSIRINLLLIILSIIYAYLL